MAICASHGDNMAGKKHLKPLQCLPWAFSENDHIKFDS